MKILTDSASLLSQGRKDDPNFDEAGNLDHIEEMERANKVQDTLRIPYSSPSCQCPSPFNARFCTQREMASGARHGNFYLTGEASLASKTSANSSHNE
ncbi:hypothetical protein WG66_011369 [Moniliophthora roreri]|nr:hypothetical protein WG66_011369 [Moniliophthora roreri]